MIKGAYTFGSKKIDLAKEFDLLGKLKFEDLFKKTGIKNIYRTEENENSLTLAIDASQKIIKNLNEKIESLLFVSQSHVSSIPASGCLLHEKLNLDKECFVLDIVQGCSGFPYALLTATNLINSNQFKNCLIVCSETYTKYIDKKDATCAPIFSDAASAFFINKENIPKILSSYSYTDGAGAKNLCIEKKNGKNFLFMHGAKVFTFTAEKIPAATNILLERAKLKMKDVKYFIFHQASSIVLKTIKDKLQIPENIFFNDIEAFGNTVSSTIPIALIIAEQKKIIPKKEPILIMGFGVGYSLCGGIFIFD